MLSLNSVQSNYSSTDKLSSFSGEIWTSSFSGIHNERNVSISTASYENSSVGVVTTDSDMEELSYEWHMVMGFIYLFTGIIGLIANGLLANKLKRNPPFRNASRMTLHLSLAVADAGIVGGFPLTSPSCFGERWLFGEVGCQIYGFSGMLFGITAILHLMFIAVDIYIHRKGQHPALPQRNYVRQALLAWFGGLLAAIMPLFGWASYKQEPSGHSCTLNWRQVDVSYVSYLLVISVCCYAVPFCIMFYCHTVSMIENTKSTDNPSDVSESQHELLEWKLSKIMRGLTIYSLLIWSPFALICINSLFYDPEDVPILLSAMPGLIVKIGSCIIPVMYLVYIYSCTRLCERNQVSITRERTD